MLFYCWANVIDDGPTLKQHRPNVSCLLGSQWKYSPLITGDLSSFRKAKYDFDSLTLTAVKYLYINHGDQWLYFQFEIILNMINILENSSRFFWIPTVHVMGQQPNILLFEYGDRL